MSEQSTAFPATSDTMSYTTADDLKAVRAFVSSRAVARGLPAHRVDLLALAVSELATNTLQHTASGGRVGVWAETGQLICAVVDQGTIRSFDHTMPAADAVRGRGLAIVGRVCDDVSIATTPEGILVRIGLDL